MEERRKNKRMELQSKIMLKALNGEEPKEISIEVTDVSKSGIGFSCKKALEIGTVYESYLTLWTKEVIHAFLQIARIELKGDVYDHGAVFIGMPEMDTSKIEIYRVVSESEK
ncbi:MAG: PilZ domain-containing protein [Lachnoclostridium sp.]|nr:PilZ domain-containing protein [Lachnospira sp.]MCM1248572.1 PilZ domain-containing protein [Lachnoclostridium sp.]MCM1536334.1 PilZ domain-containing protein [Clostridium sp.]